MMQWFDGGDSTLTALGGVYNYTVECEFGRYRLWKVSQTWYREDLDSTILLKSTWRENCDAAKELAEAWERAYEHVCALGRGQGDRIKSAAQNTRETRQRLARKVRSFK